MLSTRPALSLRKRIYLANQAQISFIDGIEWSLTSALVVILMSKKLLCQESNNANIFGSKRREHERVRGQSRKAPYMVPKTREDQQSHGKSKNMNSDLDLVGKMPPESHRRRALIFLPDQSCLSADKKRDMKKIVHGNYGKDRVISGLVNSTSTETMQQHGQRKRGHRDSGEEVTGYQRNYNNKRVVADTEDAGWEKIKIENEWQSFPRRVVGDSIVDVDRAKAGRPAIVLPNTVQLLKPGSGNTHYHQKRR